jgi:hypothetical protein
MTIEQRIGRIDRLGPHEGAFSQSQLRILDFPVSFGVFGDIVSCELDCLISWERFAAAVFGKSGQF